MSSPYQHHQHVMKKRTNRIGVDSSLSTKQTGEDETTGGQAAILRGLSGDDGTNLTPETSVSDATSAERSPLHRWSKLPPPPPSPSSSHTNRRAFSDSTLPPNSDLTALTDHDNTEHHDETDVPPKQPQQFASRYDYDDKWNLIGQRRNHPPLWEEPSPRLLDLDYATPIQTSSQATSTTYDSTRPQSTGSLYGPSRKRRTCTARYRPRPDDNGASDSDKASLTDGWENDFVGTPDFLDMPSSAAPTPRQRRDSETLSSDDARSESMDTTSTGSGGRRRRRINPSLQAVRTGSSRRRPGGVPETINESSYLRQSLDAGMARLRRWIFALPDGPPGVANGASAGNTSSQQASPQQTTRQRTGSLTTDDSFSSEQRSMMIPSRQRALSESDAQMRDFFLHGNETNSSDGASSVVSGSPLATSAANTSVGHSSNNASISDDDPNRDARMRWVRINRRFQLTITIVALIFSLLLFSILVCWVILISAYVLSIDRDCDVPLKSYFWLATLQLILDVFRTDIMRWICRWEPTSNDRIPVRVIIYNLFYLIYALLVLRLGFRSVYVSESTCDTTAPELFKASETFVLLSIAAWSTIVLGYLVPFCFVATLLTWNGYNPATDFSAGAFSGVAFPAAFSRQGAPAGFVDEMRTLSVDSNFRGRYPKDCCICMNDFAGDDVVVVTECNHVFHKRCCREWLRQARTCPVCRSDVVADLEANRGGIAPGSTGQGHQGMSSSADTVGTQSSASDHVASSSNATSTRSHQHATTSPMQERVLNIVQMFGVLPHVGRASSSAYQQGREQDSDDGDNNTADGFVGADGDMEMEMTSLEEGRGTGPAVTLANAGTTSRMNPGRVVLPRASSSSIGSR